MRPEQDSIPPRTAEIGAPAVRPGLIVEDSGCRDHARRFRVTIPADRSAAFLTTEEAIDLGCWLIRQGAARTA